VSTAARVVEPAKERECDGNCGGSSVCLDLEIFMTENTKFSVFSFVKCCAFFGAVQSVAICKNACEVTFRRIKYFENNGTARYSEFS